jgi:hypothetical protein
VTERAPGDGFATTVVRWRTHPRRCVTRGSVQGFAFAMTANFLESNGSAFHAYLPGFGVRCSMRQPSERTPTGPCLSAEHHIAGSVIRGGIGRRLARFRYRDPGRRWGQCVAFSDVLPMSRGIHSTLIDCLLSRRFENRAQITSLRKNSHVAPEILPAVAPILHRSMRGGRRPPDHHP